MIVPSAPPVQQAPSDALRGNGATRGCSRSRGFGWCLKILQLPPVLFAGCSAFRTLCIPFQPLRDTCGLPCSTQHVYHAVKPPPYSIPPPPSMSPFPRYSHLLGEGDACNCRLDRGSGECPPVEVLQLPLVLFADCRLQLPYSQHHHPLEVGALMLAQRSTCVLPYFFLPSG